MGRRVPIPMAASLGADGVPQQSAERIVNGYAKIAPKGKQQTPVYGAPGAVAWATGINGVFRGGRVIKGIPYAVYDDALIRFASDGSWTELGTIPNSDRVALAGDGTNVVVVSEGEIYVWNGSTLSAVTDADAPSASSVDWVDGYFIFGETDSDSYFISALDDPTSYDALDFAAAEWQPDALVTPYVVRRTVYMLGALSLEAAQNVGTDFPFQRYDDLFIDVGVAGREAAVATNESLFFLASDKTVRRLDGLTATPISDDPVKTLIEGWSDTSLTIASAHVWKNRLWIYFWNPDGCVVYDQSTERWHIRRSHGSETTRYSRIVEAYGKVLAFATDEGTVYELSETAYDEDGEVLPFEVTCPPFFLGSPFSLDEVEAVCQTGVGTGDLDPKLALEVSEDGETFGPRQYCSIGRSGQRDAEVQFGAQGTFEAATLRLTITAPVQRAVLGIFAEIDSDA